MNLYIRYFTEETLVKTIEEAISFLESIPEIEMDDFLRGEVVEYVASDMPYPKRVKVHQRSYFIMIKTDAETLEEFKSYGVNENSESDDYREDAKEMIQRSLYEEMPGWYQGSILFKRVISIPSTGKFAYEDTEFVAQVKAHCIQECYDRIIDYLQNREDIDPRSQYPSVKGRNFICEYLGMDPNPALLSASIEEDE